MLEGFLRSLEQDNTKAEYEPILQMLKEAVQEDNTPSTTASSSFNSEASLSEACNVKNAWEDSDCWYEDVPE